MKQSLICILVAAALSAQTVSRPAVGIVLDDPGNLRTVFGVFSNLLPAKLFSGLTAHADPPYLSAAFSNSGGAVKTANAVLITDASARFQFAVSAPDGPSIFAFDANGAPQWAYFAATAQLENLRSGAVLDTHGWGDEVLALGTATDSALAILVRDGNTLTPKTVSLDNGGVSDATPLAGAGPAIAYNDGWLVCATPQQLAWLSANGSPVTTIDVPERIRTLQAAAANTIAVNGKWLLNPHGELLRIPFASPIKPLFQVRPK